MSRELPDDLHESIKRFCAEGDSFAEAARFSDAVARYEHALSLLPPPIHNWEAATWIYAAIGDAHFLAGDFERARKALTAALLCPNALDNPFLGLRRGQVYFELGDMKQAQDCLASAFMLGGREILKREDGKYADFILPKMGAGDMTASEKLANHTLWTWHGFVVCNSSVPFAGLLSWVIVRTAVAQGIVLLLGGMCLDGGHFLFTAVMAAAAYWAALLIIIVRHPATPALAFVIGPLVVYLKSA